MYQLFSTCLYKRNIKATYFISNTDYSILNVNNIKLVAYGNPINFFYFIHINTSKYVITMWQSITVVGILRELNPCIKSSDRTVAHTATKAA